MQEQQETSLISNDARFNESFDMNTILSLKSEKEFHLERALREEGKGIRDAFQNSTLESITKN